VGVDKTRTWKEEMRDWEMLEFLEMHQEVGQLNDSAYVLRKGCVCRSLQGSLNA
jgi:hypothetical protein